MREMYTVKIRKYIRAQINIVSLTYIRFKRLLGKDQCLKNIEKLPNWPHGQLLKNNNFFSFI